MKIFLLSSCRVHRPFNCDKDHKDGEFKNYDCLYSKWHETFFLGSLYCSNYILEVIKTLTYRENKQLINTGPPYFEMNDHKFNLLCNKFHESSIVIIEIATLKYLILENGVIISNEHRKQFENYKECVLSEDQLKSNIEEIQEILHKNKKYCLFVSHFHVYNIKNREIICRCMREKAKYYFDPTPIVLKNIEENIKDSDHFTVECEKIIMKHIDDHLKIIIKENNL